jgi:hypothetical protein
MLVGVDADVPPAYGQPSVLPSDEKKQVLPGSFSVFADRRKIVVSSTNPDYPVGSPLPLKDDLFRYKKGERESTIVDLDGCCFALGLQVSEGYREYKQGDGYVNDLICVIFVPI